jgi:hypothetical protein
MTSPSDRQSRAFREAEPGDRWDGDILGLGARVHMPADSLDRLALPEHYETGRGWDQHRQPPKTLSEARAQLAERIADPGAPDSEDDAGAYDDLDGP